MARCRKQRISRYTLFRAVWTNLALLDRTHAFARGGLVFGRNKPAPVAARSASRLSRRRSFFLERLFVATHRYRPWTALGRRIHGSVFCRLELARGPLSPSETVAGADAIQICRFAFSA